LRRTSTSASKKAPFSISMKYIHLHYNVLLRINSNYDILLP
jgi:hypothetical protein